MLPRSRAICEIPAVRIIALIELRSPREGSERPGKPSPANNLQRCQFYRSLMVNPGPAACLWHTGRAFVAIQTEQEGKELNSRLEQDSPTRPERKGIWGSRDGGYSSISSTCTHTNLISQNGSEKRRGGNLSQINTLPSSAQGLPLPLMAWWEREAPANSASPSNYFRLSLPTCNQTFIKKSS